MCSEPAVELLATSAGAEAERTVVAERSGFVQQLTSLAAASKELGRQVESMDQAGQGHRKIASVEVEVQAEQLAARERVAVHAGGAPFARGLVRRG